MMKNKGLGRRSFLMLGAGAVTAMVTGSPAQAAVKIKTRVKIVIAGAGAAGLAAASRLATMLDGATITLVDARKEHFYQPGYTLIGAGLKPAAYSVSSTREYVTEGRHSDRGACRRI